MKHILPFLALIAVFFGSCSKNDVISNRQEAPAPDGLANRMVVYTNPETEQLEIIRFEKENGFLTASRFDMDGKQGSQQVAEQQLTDGSVKVNMVIHNEPLVRADFIFEQKANDYRLKEIRGLIFNTITEGMGVYAANSDNFSGTYRSATGNPNYLVINNMNFAIGNDRNITPSSQYIRVGQEAFQHKTQFGGSFGVSIPAGASFNGIPGPVMVIHSLSIFPNIQVMRKI